MSVARIRLRSALCPMTDLCRAWSRRISRGEARQRLLIVILVRLRLSQDTGDLFGTIIMRSKSLDWILNYVACPELRRLARE
jgi:hypothetical protein